MAARQQYGLARKTRTAPARAGEAPAATRTPPAGATAPQAKAGPAQAPRPKQKAAAADRTPATPAATPGPAGKGTIPQDRNAEGTGAAAAAPADRPEGAAAGEAAGSTGGLCWTSALGMAGAAGPRARRGTAASTDAEPAEAVPATPSPAGAPGAPGSRSPEAVGPGEGDESLYAGLSRLGGFWRAGVVRQLVVCAAGTGRPAGRSSSPTALRRAMALVRDVSAHLATARDGALAARLESDAITDQESLARLLALLEAHVDTLGFAMATAVYQALTARSGEDLARLEDNLAMALAEAAAPGGAGSSPGPSAPRDTPAGRQDAPHPALRLCPLPGGLMPAGRS